MRRQEHLNQDRVSFIVECRTKSDYFCFDITISRDAFKEPERQARFIRRIAAEQTVGVVTIKAFASQFDELGAKTVHNTMMRNENAPADVISEILGYTKYAFNCMKYGYEF